MSIELAFTGTAALASVVTPPVLMGVFKTHRIFAYIAAVIGSNIFAWYFFHWVKPEFHDGPLMGLAIVMNVIITGILAGAAVAVAAITINWMKLNHE